MDIGKIRIIAGLVLIIIGLLLIILPLWQTYNILTGKTMPSQVFQRPESLKINTNVSAIDIGGQVQNALIKILPIDLVNNTLNLATWLLLMWILIYGGGKIADIGVKLLNGPKQ
jgi:hypothetical protein